MVTLIRIQVDTSDALRTCTAWAAIGLKVVPARLTGATSVIGWVGEAEGRRWGGGGGFFYFPFVCVCMCVCYYYYCVYSTTF